MAMKVGLKIWRYDSSTGMRALREYEIDAPEEATLLDCLDIVKDRHDGSLSYRKSCRMMICGSCGMRMDGGAVLACKTRMYDIVQAGSDRLVASGKTVMVSYDYASATSVPLPDATRSLLEQARITPR